MNTCLAMEWPGRWRVGGVAALLALPVLPTLPLLACAFATNTLGIGGYSFITALGNSLVVAGLTALTAFALGLPAGILNALYGYRGRRLFLTLALLPLLVPPFLWAVGWRCLMMHFARPLLPMLSGYSGCVLVFLPGAVTLVLFTAIASTASLSGSQVDAARLAGGELTLFRLAYRQAAIPSLLAAVLAAILTLSDPGAGFAVGLPVASTEILLSFTAFYDYGLAGRQSLLLTAVVLVGAIPLAIFAGPRLAAEAPARQVRVVQRRLHPDMGLLAGMSLSALVMLTVLPIWGLILPLKYWRDVTRACAELSHVGMNTVIYAAGAGFCAAALGMILAFCAGRQPRLRRLAIGVSLTLFALPPIFLALGVSRGVAHMPEWTDLLLRGRALVCLVLGVRFLPVAAVLALRSWGTMAPALARAAGVHGVSAGRYLLSVVLPLQRRALGMAMLLVGLLATAETGMVLLLYPPGEETLPLRIFQILGYPEPSSRLAALCLVDLALAVGLLALAWFLCEGDAT